MTGHDGPVEHFLVDADMIMQEAFEHGIRFESVGATENQSMSFVEVQ
jgi:hypothetical protein